MHLKISFFSDFIEDQRDSIFAHYNDIIMITLVSQITCLTIVYSTIYSRHRSKKTSKAPCHWSLCRDFPAQRASNAENASISWCHHDSFLLMWCCQQTIHISHASNLSCLLNSFLTCCQLISIWRHHMETLSTLLALFQGNPLVTSEFPTHRASDAELFADFFLFWHWPEPAVKQTIVLPVMLMWHHCTWR